MRTCIYCGIVFGSHEDGLTDYDTTCPDCHSISRKMEAEALELNRSTVLKEKLCFESEEESENE